MSLGNEIRIGGVKAASETGSIRAPSVGGGSAMRSGTAMERGAMGPMGPQGPKGDTGATGPAGADGVSVTHRWNGTVLEVTSASGTSSADLKGDPGTVTAVKVAGETHEPDDTGVVDLGQITGGADLSDDAPAPLGTAAAGTSELAARADHMHKMPTAAQVGAATAEEVSQLKDDMSEKLGKTETAADSAKLGGKAPEYYLSPRNLLDNSDFRNPVNQRGNSVYTSSTWCLYTIDRWCIESNEADQSVTINDDGTITFKHTGSEGSNLQFEQKLEIPIAKGNCATVAVFVTKMTGSAELSYAMVDSPYTGFANCDIQSGINVASGEVTADGDCKVRIIIDPNSSVTMKWIALYEGSYTADTLPPYVPKGYAAELAECRRYAKYITGALAGIAHGYESGKAYATIFTSGPKMRIAPSVADYSKIMIINGEYYSINFTPITGISTIAAREDSITFWIESSEISAGKDYYISCDSGVLFSSDL